MHSSCNSNMTMVILLCILMSTAACAPQYKVPEINAEYYPQCVQPFQELANAQKALMQRTVLTGALGVAGGALLGGLISGDVRGAVIGGILGGIAAGTAGYASGKQSQIKDVKARLRSYRTDMRTDISNMSQVELYSMLSLQCYLREFKGLLKDFRAHRIKESDFKKRYTEIRHGMQQISVVLSDAYEQTLKRDSEFRAALVSERSLAQQKAKSNRTLEAAAKKTKRQLRDMEKATSLDKMERLVSKCQQDAKLNATRQGDALKHTLDTQTDTSLDTISNDFDTDYTTTTVRIASTRDMYSKTMTIMDEAASHAGIDMVYMPDTDFTSTLTLNYCI